jgi:hypothetical protein
MIEANAMWFSVAATVQRRVRRQKESVSPPGTPNAALQEQLTREPKMQRGAENYLGASLGDFSVPRVRNLYFGEAKTGLTTD